MKIKMILLAAVVAFSLNPDLSAKERSERRPPDSNERPIDLVICLDTSNSMDGLIGAAKQKLWDIVNELGKARPKPHLRVGLYSYGTPSYGAETGFVRKEIDLTDDLDSVYAKLTALVTSGGDEYVARVVRASVNEQSWSPDRDALKIIVVAGNEPATQDPRYQTPQVCKEAITRGITINAIYCGPPTNPEAGGWREVARAADGQFAAIDQDHGVVTISTPFDDKLAALSGEINKTYIAYGARAEEGAKRQLQMDSVAALSSPSVSASRAVAKAGGQYRNSAWDLVDARKQKDFDLAKVKKEDLPEEMQKMTSEEQKNHLDSMAKKRDDVQKEINDMSVQRKKYIDAEIKKSGKSTDKAFDAAMLKAIREQALRRNFTFEENPK